MCCLIPCGSRPRVLNHFAIHVSDVQRTIRADLHLHWRNQVIRRGEKLPVTLIVRASRHEAIPSRLKFLSVNEIAPQSAMKASPEKSCGQAWPS